MKISHLLIFLFLFFGLAGAAQEIHKDIRKAEKRHAKDGLDLALPLLQKQKQSGDEYNQLVASILEIRWREKDEAENLLVQLEQSSRLKGIMDEYPSDSLVGFYFSTFARHQFLHAKDYKLAVSTYSKALENYQVSLRESPASLARKYMQHADYSWWNKEYDTAVNQYLKADSIYAAIPLPADLYLADSYQMVHKSYLSNKQYQESVNWFEKAEKVFSNMELWSHLARLCYNQGSAYFQLKDIHRSNELFGQSGDIVLKYDATTWVKADMPYLETSKNFLYQLKTPEKANQQAKLGLKYLTVDRHNSWAEFDLTYTLALSFRQLKMPDSALFYSRRCFELETSLLKDTCRLGASYQDLGVYLKEAGLIKESLEAFEKLTSLLSTCGADKKALLDNYQKIGVEYYNLLGDTQKAGEYWEKTLTLWRELKLPEDKEYAILLLDLGNAHGAIGRGKEGKALLKRAAHLFRQFGETNLEFRTRKDLGYALLQLEQLDSAYRILSDGLRESKEMQVEDRYIGLFHIHLGEYFEKIRDYDNALRQYRMALPYLRGADVAQAYSFIGGIHFNREHSDSALYYYDRTESILVAEKAFTPNKQMLLLINRAKIYKDLKKFSEAALMYQNAIEIYRRTYEANLVWAMNAYIDLLDCYYQLGLADQFESTSKDMQSVLDRLGTDRNKAYVSVFNKLAQTFMRSNTKKAVEFCQIAFYHNTRQFNGKDTFINPNSADFISAPEFLSTARRKAAILVMMADEADSSYNKLGQLTKIMTMRLDNYMGNDKNKFYHMALATYMLCDTIINYTRDLYPTEEAKQELSGEATEIFELAIFNAYLAYQRTGDSTFLYQAYHFMGQNKARALLEAVQRTSARAFRNVPEELLQEERMLNEELTQLGIQYGTTQMPVIKARYDEKRVQLNLLLEQIQQTNPKYRELRGSDNIATANEIMSKLQDNMAYIEYFVDFDGTGVIIATMTRYKLDFHFKKFDAPLDKKIKGWRNAMLHRLGDLEKNYAGELYADLIEPAIEHIGDKDKWVIIPDNLLGYLPFEALTDATNRYLIETKEISYSYSGTLFSQNEPRYDSVKTILAFAPVFEHNETNLLVAGKKRELATFNEQLETSRAFLKEGGRIASLPGTITEVKQIAILYESNGGLSDNFIHREANEEQIKAMDLTKYRYLHFATHGIVDENNPQLSGLIMAQDPKSKEDCILYSGEVYNLKMDAALVTLSACETGLGKVMKGEGIVGLSRAFIYAGAENVQVSLWKVSDASTSELMINFYQGILGGDSHAKALREAKLNLLRSPNFHDPYYWAPFILIGL